MFTGIVQCELPLLAIEKKPGLETLIIELNDDMRSDLAIGASVAIDGVCLTVTKIAHSKVYFDVMQQTLNLTSLGDLNSGDRVNVERSAKQGVEIGGHIVSGHVDGTVEVVDIEYPENNCFITYKVPADKMKYIFSKGFIALNGCSLTVAEIDKEKCTFQVCYIPETMRVTTHGNKQVGDRLNFEVDRQTQTIVETVENFLKANPSMFTSK